MPEPQIGTPARPLSPMPGYAGVAAVLAVCVIATGAIWLFRSANRREPGNPQVRVGSGVQSYQPAVSADGKRVAFVQEQQIWIDTGGNSRRLVTSSPGHYESPVWSPGGESLALLRLHEHGGEVVIMPAEGGQEKVLSQVSAADYDFPFRRLDWSADGRMMGVSGAGSPALHAVSLDTGEKKQLTYPTEGASDVEPRFSPDGKLLAFVRHFDRGRQELFVTNLADGKTQQLTRDNHRVTGCDWHGSTIVFASDRGGEFRIWSHPNVGGEATAPMGGRLSWHEPIQFSIAKHAPVLVYSVAGQNPGIQRLDLHPDQSF